VGIKGHSAELEVGFSADYMGDYHLYMGRVHLACYAEWTWCARATGTAAAKLTTIPENYIITTTPASECTPIFFLTGGFPQIGTCPSWH